MTVQYSSKSCFWRVNIISF